MPTESKCEWRHTASNTFYIGGIHGETERTQKVFTNIYIYTKKIIIQSGKEETRNHV